MGRDLGKSSAVGEFLALLFRGAVGVGRVEQALVLVIVGVAVQ